MSDQPMIFEQEEIEFYALIGRAISQWNNVEDALLRVFHASLIGAHFGPASSAFYAATAFSTKLDLTDAAIGFRLAGLSLHSEWSAEKTGLKRKLGRMSGQRNRLAHFHVYGAPQAKPGKRFHLEPSIHNARTWAAVKDDVITIDARRIETCVWNSESSRRQSAILLRTLPRFQRRPKHRSN